MPVHIGILWPDETAARNAPAGDITLHFCQTCGHIFNASFLEERMDYDLPYDNSLFFSGVFRQYAQDLAARLIEKYELTHKNIIEIGSGIGDFLKLICELGNNKGWGFDPSYQPDFSGEPIRKQLTFIQGYYENHLVHEKIDFLFARHTLEHLPNPKELIQQLKQDFNHNREIVFYFEVPNADFMLRETKLWDLIYEHCQYFTTSSLRYLFEGNGFEVLDLYEAFDEQYLCIECRIVSDREKITPKPAHSLEEVTNFSENSKKMIQAWREYFTTLAHKNLKSVIWGAGAKGVSFLNIVKKPEMVIGVIDLNPRKQKKFIPITAHPIFLPEELKVIQPDRVIIMNPIYFDEIKNNIKEYGFREEICVHV